MAKRKPLPYREGSLFLVPLKDGGFARGIVTRATRYGRVIYGYFFGPRIQSAEEATFDDIRPDNFHMRAKFGDLGLYDGSWKVMGMLPNWNREEWPMPDRMTRSNGWFYLVRYSDTNPNKTILVQSVPEDDPSLETDQMRGSGAVEIVLNKELNGGKTS
jgi:hypothetical protein